MQLSRSKLRASPLRPADKSASCLPSRVIAAKATAGKKKPAEEQRARRRTATTGRKPKTHSGVAKGCWRKQGNIARGTREGGSQPAARCTMALACARPCLLFTESLECEQRARREGGGGRGDTTYCTVRGCAHVLQLPSSVLFLSLPFRLPTVSSPRGPRTNNCPPVNSRYDTRRGRSVTPIPPAAIGDRRGCLVIRMRFAVAVLPRSPLPGAKNAPPARKNPAATIFHAGDSEYRPGTRALFARTAIGPDVLMPGFNWSTLTPFPGLT